jgi:hypothetical protein
LAGWKTYSKDDNHGGLSRGRDAASRLEPHALREEGYQMIRKWLAIAIVVIFAVSLVGCASGGGYYSEGRSAGAGALGGAATGAALGAIIGAATGSPATGAWIGAAAGSVVGGIGGYLYAKHRNSEVSSAQAAAEAHNYQGNGYVVSVDGVTASPTMVRPGQEINLGMDYTILTPSNQMVPVTLVREVRYQGRTIGSPYQTTVNNNNGTYNDFVSYTVDRNAAPGQYTVISRVTSSYGSSARDSYFTVQ